MAQYTITHSCNHEEVVQIYGPEKERPGKAAWMAKQPCPTCKRSQQIAQASARADTCAADLGLVELTGSEKQTNWAKTLRQEFVDEFERRIAKARDSEEEVARARKAYLTILNRHTDARFWIDHRGEGTRLFAKEFEVEYAR